MIYKYRPLLRPPSYLTMPPGLHWNFAEAPSYLTTRPDLPRSRHKYGVISTTRELTPAELNDYNLERVTT